LTELNNLTLIDLTDNAGLNNVDNLAKLQNLEYLYVYGCGLTKLPDNIGDLKNLKELGLVGNNLNNTERTRIKKALPTCIIKF
jgi:Leucine-rich repeat (LRR) protein